MRILNVWQLPGNGAAMLLISKSDLEVSRSVFHPTQVEDGGAACEECMSFSRKTTFDGNVARVEALYSGTCRLQYYPGDAI